MSWIEREAARKAEAAAMAVREWPPKGLNLPLSTRKGFEGASIPTTPQVLRQMAADFNRALKDPTLTDEGAEAGFKAIGLGWIGCTCTYEFQEVEIHAILRICADAYIRWMAERDSRAEEPL